MPGTMRNAGLPSASISRICGSRSGMALQIADRPPSSAMTVIRRGKLPSGMRISPATVSRPSSSCSSGPCGPTFHSSLTFDMWRPFTARHLQPKCPHPHFDPKDRYAWCCSGPTLSAGCAGLHRRRNKVRDQQPRDDERKYHQQIHTPMRRALRKSMPVPRPPMRRSRREPLRDRPDRRGSARCPPLGATPLCS